MKKHPNSSTTRITTSHDHIADLQLKNRILCALILTYLLMLVRRFLLDAYQSFQAHDEQKTRKIGYRDAITHYVPETTYHKPSLCLMLIIREPHFHLTLF